MLFRSSLDAEMQPLRMVLRLDENEFAEGVFWWKGFLYYQWMYGAISAQTKATIAKVAQVRTADKMEADVRTELDRVRRFLVEQIVSSTERIKAMLEVYTQAYAKLTKTGEPVAFRDFLLKSPEHFVELGGRIGVLDHIKSFCDFRFPDGEIVKISAPELLDVFHEFEGHFGVQQKEYAPAKLAS